MWITNELLTNSNAIGAVTVVGRQEAFWCFLESPLIGFIGELIRYAAVFHYVVAITAGRALVSVIGN